MVKAIENYTVYILECADQSYYIGITNDIERRLFEHQSGYSTTAYTFKKRPVKLVFTENFSNPSEAIAFEKQIKGWRRDKKKALIDGNWELLPELSKRYKK